MSMNQNQDTGADYLLRLAAQVIDAAEAAGIRRADIYGIDVNAYLAPTLWVDGDPPAGFAITGELTGGHPFGDLDLGEDERTGRVYFRVPR
jgi:hypothetical protein